MKKNSKIFKSGTMFILMLLALVLTATLFVCMPKKVVSAEELELDDSKVIEQGYGLYKIQDQALYDALFDELRRIKPEAEKLTVGSFLDIPTEEFNFSGEGKSDKTKISSLVGLNLIKLPNLKSLILSNNKITGSVSDFSFMPNLEKIDLSNNKITSFDGSFSTKLTTVNLSNNNIGSVNLGSLAEGGSADVSFNALKQFDKITLPQVTCEISLTHNFLIEDIPSDIACTLKMGFQGIKNGDDILKTTKFRFYELDGVENLKLYKKLSDGTYILAETILPNNEVTNLNIAEYKLEFNETNGPKKYDDLTFTCRPTSPIITVYSNNEVIQDDSHIFRQIISLKIEAEGEIYYQINNGKTVQGNEILINKSGSYTVTYWQKLEGMDSVKTSYLVISKYFAPINVVWIILVIAVFVIGFGLALYYKNVLLFKKSSKTARKDFE